MFSFLGKESAPVQLYGKLPIAKDYLRVGAGQGAGQMFRDWLDRAFSQAPNAKEALTLPWPMAFVLGDAWGAPLVGAAWASSDAGGLRPFPFVTFLERKKKPVLEDLEAGGPVAAAIWQRLHEVYDAREQHSDAQSFLGAMRNQQVEVEKLEAPPQTSVEFDAWIAALWPDDGRDGLLATLCALEALRKQAHRGPIRLPLAVDLPPLPQAHAWLKLLVEMNLVGRDALPSMFFPLPQKHSAPEAEPAPSDSFGSSSFDSFSSSSSSSFDSPSAFDAPSDSMFGSSDASASDAPSSDFGSTDWGAADSSSSDAPAEPSGPPSFVTFFRTPPAPADAVWLRAPLAGRASPAGDLCPPRARSTAGAGAAPEQLPPLWDSLRGAYVSLRARIR